MISSQYETQPLKSHPHVPILVVPILVVPILVVPILVVPILVVIHFVELVLPKLQQLRQYFLHEPW